MAAIRSSHTAPERIVRSVVHGLGYRFRLHSRTLPGRPDLVLTRLRSVIFVHGCFWHGHHCPDGRRPSSRQGYWIPKLDANKCRDRRHSRTLRQLGWRVLVVWECETVLPKRAALEAKILRFLVAAQRSGHAKLLPGKDLPRAGKKLIRQRNLRQ